MEFESDKYVEIESQMFQDELHTVPVTLTCYEDKLSVAGPLLSDLQQYVFSWDLKFQLLRGESSCRTVENKKVIELGEAYGLALEKPGAVRKVYYHPDHETLVKWKQVLARSLTQLGFHNLYKPFKKIGKGGSGVVYLGERLETHQKVAIKAFSKETLNKDPNGLRALLNEILIMRGLQHRSLLPIYEVFQTENTIYLVLQYLEGGQLSDHVRVHVFAKKEIQRILYALLSGLKYMHELQVIHRDLKPQNIICRKGGSYDPVIADFGLATWIHEDEYIFTRCGTPGFAAPEIIKAEIGKKQETSCDMFSLGAIAYLLAVGKVPFPGHSYRQILQINAACKLNYDSDECKNVDPALMDLIKKLMHPNPDMRPTAAEALGYNFFKEIAEEEECQSPINSPFVFGEGVNLVMRKELKEQKDFSLDNPQFKKKRSLDEDHHVPQTPCSPKTPMSPWSPAGFRVEEKKQGFGFAAKQQQIQSAFLSEADTKGQTIQQIYS